MSTNVFAYIRTLIGIKGVNGTSIASNSNPLPVSTVNSLVKEPYDNISITYNPDNTIQYVDYYLGVAKVARLSLIYSGGNLSSVTKGSIP